jgi:CRISPR-associated protein Cas5d
MPPSVRLFIAGDLASFTRPEAKVERNSYALPTPSAARNILDSILWKPEFRWIVTRILLVKHPRATADATPALPLTIALKRNELQSTIAPRTVSGWMQDPSSYEPQAAGAGQGTDGTPRMTTALKNVAYVIEAYPHVFTPVGAEGQINTPQKYVACLERRAAKGQCRSQPYLGCREFAAEFRLATDADTPLDVTENLGRMLYDIVFSAPGGKKPVFFDAKLVSGVLNTRPEDVLTDAAARAEVLACSYKR